MTSLVAAVTCEYDLDNLGYLAGYKGGGRAQGKSILGWSCYFCLVQTSHWFIYFKASIRIVLVMGVCVFGPGIVRLHQKKAHQVKSYDSPIVSAGRKL